MITANIVRRLQFSLLLSITLCPAAAAGDTWSTPFHGIKYLHRTTSNPTWNIHVAVVNLSVPGVSLTATASKDRRTTVSSFAKREGVQLAVNASYFSYENYNTIGPSVGEGKAWPGIKDEKRSGQLAFGDGKTIIIEPAEIVKAETWMRGMVSGHPLLVRDGQPVKQKEQQALERHPRTAVGLSKDRRTLFLLVVDGRQRSSIGMTAAEEAKTLKGLGAWTALNLDGGGSSAMYIKGRGVVNSPSDGNERVVANHLGVFVGKAPQAKPADKDAAAKAAAKKAAAEKAAAARKTAAEKAAADKAAKDKKSDGGGSGGAGHKTDQGSFSRFFDKAAKSISDGIDVLAEAASKAWKKTVNYGKDVFKDLKSLAGDAADSFRDLVKSAKKASGKALEERTADGLLYSYANGYHVVVADLDSANVEVRVAAPRKDAADNMLSVARHAAQENAAVAINANYFGGAGPNPCGAARGRGVQYPGIYGSPANCVATMGWARGRGGVFDSAGHEKDANFMPQFTELATGGGYLLKDGRPRDWNHGKLAEHNACTAIGLSADRRKFIFVVTDSDVCTGKGLQQVLAAKGASDAIHLSGAGASKMWIKGRGYINDGGEDRLSPVAIVARAGGVRFVADSVTDLKGAVARATAGLMAAGAGSGGAQSPGSSAGAGGPVTTMPGPGNGGAGREAAGDPVPRSFGAAAESVSDGIQSAGEGAAKALEKGKAHVNDGRGAIKPPAGIAAEAGAGADQKCNADCGKAKCVRPAHPLVAQCVGHACRAGLGAAWTCDATLSQLVRCANGKVVTLTCAVSCKPDLKGGGGCMKCPSSKSLYCGGVAISGEKGTLYRCKDGFMTKVRSCPMGCVRMPAGVSDHCRAPQE